MNEYSVPGAVVVVNDYDDADDDDDAGRQSWPPKG